MVEILDLTQDDSPLAAAAKEGDSAAGSKMQKEREVIRNDKQDSRRVTLPLQERSSEDANRDGSTTKFSKTSKASSSSNHDLDSSEDDDDDSNYSRMDRKRKARGNADSEVEDDNHRSNKVQTKKTALLAYGFSDSGSDDDDDGGEYKDKAAAASKPTAPKRKAIDLQSSSSEEESSDDEKRSSPKARKVANSTSKSKSSASSDDSSSADDDDEPDEAERWLDATDWLTSSSRDDKLNYLTTIASVNDKALQLLLWDLGFDYNIFEHQFEAIRRCAGLVKSFPLAPSADSDNSDDSDGDDEDAEEMLLLDSIGWNSRKAALNRNDLVLTGRGILLADEMGKDFCNCSFSAS